MVLGDLGWLKVAKVPRGGLVWAQSGGRCGNICVLVLGTGVEVCGGGGEALSFGEMNVAFES